MTRILVHAGFHKTGTTSLQRMLIANRRKLETEFRVFLRKDMLPLCETARGYSLKQDPLELALFSYEAARFFQGLSRDDPRPVCVSSEDLSGHMPGRHGLVGYDAAPRLMACLAETAAKCLPDPEITFFFSTRQPEAWVKSCYGQHLNATRMVDDFATYERDHMPHADLAAVVQRIADTVAQSPVVSAALEDSAQTLLGPLGPLLDILQPSPKMQAELTPLPAANVARSEDILAELLRMNRSDLDKKALAMAKKALLSNR